jgi:hypothetical protein
MTMHAFLTRIEQVTWQAKLRPEPRRALGRAVMEVSLQQAKELILYGPGGELMNHDRPREGWCAVL